MSRERPGPGGRSRSHPQNTKFPSDHNPNSSFASDRNQYLETGELNYQPYYYEPSYGMYNQPSRGYQHQPGPNRSFQQDNPEHLKSYLAEWARREPSRYRKWYNEYKAHKENPRKYPLPPVPGYQPHAVFQQQYHQPNYPPSQYTPHPPHMSDRTRNHSSSMNYSNSSQYDHDRGVKMPSGRSSVAGSFFNPDFEDDESYSGKWDNENGVTTETSPDRLTPQKFLSGHSIGLITPFGHVLRVAGGSRTVEIQHVKTIMKDLPEYRELETFPGPLVRGRTDKNTVIKFCQKKIRSIQNQDMSTDKENFILLWEYLILLLNKNGRVDGSDVAELLLKKKGKLEQESELNSNHSEGEDETDDADDGDSGVSKVNHVAPAPNEAKITQEFCDRLFFGNKEDALEFAMKKGLWGHALFFASKISEKEFNKVMLRFANGIAYNHPLQTLYQFMSGEVPLSANGCLDDSFGDWRPHLAMLISNAGMRPEVEEQKALVTLGNTLKNKKLIFASQFCHLRAELTFSNDSKLGPLLGLLPDANNILEATQMTEIYEFAKSLGQEGVKHFNLSSSFLRSKFNYVKNLIDFGFTSQAFSYCEVIAKQMKSLSHKEDSLRWDILQIGERLKFVNGRNDSDWIQDLQNSLNTSNTNNTSESSSRRASSTTGASSSVPDQDSNIKGVESHTLDSSSYVPSYSGTFDYQNQIGGSSSQQADPASNQMSNTTGGAYEPNHLSNEMPSIPTIPTFDPSQFPDPYHSIPPSIDQNNRNPPNYSINPQKIDSNVPPWNPNPDQQQHHSLPSGQPFQPMQLQSSQYVNPDPGQQAYSLPGQKPPDVNGNEQSYYQPQQPFYDNNPGMIPTRPYDQTQQQQQPPHYQLQQSNYSNFNPAQQNSQQPNIGKKTVRFEDDKGEGGLNNGVLRMRRSKALDILKRGESEDGTETTSEEEEFINNPVQFKSTYPIDAPFGRRIFTPPNTLLRTTKVNSYPVDKKCCDTSTPCSDHSPYSPSAAPNLLQEIEQKNNDKKKDSKKDNDGKQSKPNSARSGIFGWLGLRPKNQMILPDDKEPSIVWDEAKKEWVNTTNDEDDTFKPPPAPPTKFELMGSFPQQPPQHQQQQQPLPPPNPSPLIQQQQQPPASIPYQQQHQAPPMPMPTPSSATSNSYRLSNSARGGLRGKYVDIFNQKPNSKDH